MKIFKVFLISFGLLIISCDKKSKVENAIEEIKVEMKVNRFDQAFFGANKETLQNVRAQYPFFFPANMTDAVCLSKINNPDWKGLFAETQLKYKNFEPQKDEIIELFKHIKYYFPTVVTPKIYTVIGEMDYTTKAIYANDKLIIALELYLGKDHKYYAEFPKYMKQNFEPKQILPDVVTSFAEGVVAQPQSTFITKMVYFGKQLYLKDLLLNDYSDADKIGFTNEQILWSQDNEMYIWQKLVNDNLIFSADSKLSGRFLEMAPFSKFYLEIDNESPGRIGHWIGWQIVRSYMENYPETKIQDLIKMDGKTLFESSKYKPKKNE